MERQKEVITQPLVSIITVNFNQVEVTAALLQSLRAITYPRVEILVVDNGSTTGNPDSLATDYPEITLIKSSENLGFAGGNNLAVRVATGEYLLFLNNDTEVTPGFLEPLVERMAADPTIGMISPKIRFFHTPDMIQYAGYTPMHPLTLRQHLIGFHETDHGQYDRGGYTYSIHGAAMMVRRQAIEKTGMMEELYFLYYEEHDWAARIKRVGYKIYYEPDSLVLHKESVTTGRESPLKTYYINRNRFLFARRNFRGVSRWITLMYLSLIAFPKALINYSVRKRFDLVREVWRAYTWNFVHIFKRSDKLT